MANPAATPALEAGTILADTYEVTRLIGKGGMGAVWEAQHLRLDGKKVAIKVLHADVDGEAVERFRREARIATRLGHPNIVQVIDFNAHPDGALYLVLEYLEGESLADRIRRGPLPLDHTLALLRQIGSAVAAAHSQDIVHRDLKPENIFLCPTESGGYATEQAKVLDFGISKIRGSQTVMTQTAAMLGTPQYMSPEQALGNHAAIDGRTDVFALGAIAYEMLSGQPAFAGSSIPEVVFKIVYEPPEDLGAQVPGLPPMVVAAVHRALAKKPEDRFATVSELVQALTGDPLITWRQAGVSAQAMPAGPAGPAGPRSSALPVMTGQQRSASEDALAVTMAPGHDGSGNLPTASTAGASQVAVAISTAGAQPADSPSASTRSRHWMLIGSGLAVVAAVLVTAAVMGRQSSPMTATAPATVPVPVIDAAPTRAMAPAAVAADGREPGHPDVAALPPDRPEIADKAQEQQHAAGARSGPDKTPARPVVPVKPVEPVTSTDKPDRPADRSSDGGRTLPPALAEVQDLIEQGRYEEALHRARPMLQGKNRQAARFLSTVAYCKQPDLAGARAHFQHLKGPWRQRARTVCKRSNIDLSE